MAAAALIVMPATLAGVGLNSWLGWWWADPAAAFGHRRGGGQGSLEAWAEEDDD